MKEDEMNEELQIAEWKDNKRAITEALKIKILPNQYDDKYIKNVLSVKLKYVEEQIGDLLDGIKDNELTYRQSKNNDAESLWMDAERTYLETRKSQDKTKEAKAWLEFQKCQAHLDELYEPKV